MSDDTVALQLVAGLTRADRTGDPMRPKTAAAALSAALFLSLAGSVSFAASPGFARVDLNLRSGPGTGYRVIEVMPRGAAVTISDCSTSWCRVAFGAKHGWSALRYLEMITLTPRKAVRRPSWPRYGYRARYVRLDDTELAYKWHVADTARALLERQNNDLFDCYVQTDGLIVCREE